MTQALILTVGAPGCGADDWFSRRLHPDSIIDLGEFRRRATGDQNDRSADDSVISIRAVLLRERLSRGLLTVALAPNARRDQRHPLFLMAERFDTPVIAVWFKTGIDECMKRLAAGFSEQREIRRDVVDSILRDVNDKSNVADLVATAHLRIEIEEDGTTAICVGTKGSALPDIAALIAYAHLLIEKDQPWRFTPSEVKYDDPTLAPAGDPANDPAASGGPADTPA